MKNIFVGFGDCLVVAEFDMLQLKVVSRYQQTTQTLTAFTCNLHLISITKFL